MMLRCNVTAVTDFHVSVKLLIGNYLYGADRPGEAFAGAKYGGRGRGRARIGTAKGGLPAALCYRFLRVRTCEYCLARCGENRNPSLGLGTSFAFGVLAPALSGGSPDKAGANCKDQREGFGLLMVQVRRTPVVPFECEFFLIEN
jgi:hypothetical protein